ncbi:MAG: putative lipid II flippase FtsW [Desulfovibrionales bacterium]
MSENVRTTTCPYGTLDIWLIIAVGILSAIGVVMVLSASGVVAERSYGDGLYFFYKQLLFLLLGIGLAAGVMRIPRTVFYRLVYLWVFLALAALILTLTSLGMEANGASRWIRIGPLALQPLELAKVALVFYLASFFSRKQDMVKTFSVGFLPPVAVTGVMCILLVLQPDFGGAVFMAMLLFLMSLVGGTRLIYLASSVVLAAGLGTYLVLHSPYRMQRLFAYLDPFKDIYGSGYQLVQSLYALGAGGFWGLGVGNGKQKLFYLPDAHNDFILAVIGEELGFIGLSLVFACLGVIIWRSFSIAITQQDLMDRFTGLGMSCILCVGALLNAAVVLGAIPPKGVPMPFISYGGSSLLVSFFCVGMLLNMARRGR